jgi:hypothetical protein
MTLSIRTAAAAALVALTLAGCTTTAEPTPEPSTESAYGGFAVDPPATDEVVLTVEGEMTVDFTYGELQELAIVEIEILEPFVEQEQSFTGVPLAELLAAAGVPAEARIETIALNDYRYADTVAQWTGNDALLAVFRDGELIPMDQGGPIRIVFASDSPAFELLDAWNWSLRTIAVVD